MSLGDTLRIREDAIEATKEDVSPEPKRASSFKDRFDDLRSLDCFEMVKSRLIHGHSPGSVAKYIIEEAKELGKFSRITTETGLRDLLIDFRDGLKATEMVAHTIPEAVKDIKERLDKGLDEIKELEYLYHLQRDRIEIDYSTEKKIRKLFKGTGNEVVVAMGLLKLIINMKQELGLMKKDLGTLEIDHTLLAALPYKSKAIEEVMSEPSSRAKVVGLVRRMFAKPELMGTMFGTIDEARRAVATEVEVIDEKKVSK